MSESRDALIKKFVLPVLRRPRRLGYKGLRRQVGLRLKDEVARDLQVMKMASGEDINTFCERAIELALALIIADLRSKHDDEAWKAIINCAERASRPSVDRP